MGTKKRWGDRKDARLVRDLPGLSVIMPHIMTKRTEAEVCLRYTLDVTELMRLIQERNDAHPAYHTTFFHGFLTAMARMVKERPKLNRYIQGRRTYQRDEISVSFVVKRKMEDDAEESILTEKIREDDTLDTISQRLSARVRGLKGDSLEMDGIDAVVNNFAKLPHPLLLLAGWLVRTLDFWGILPAAISDGDSNFSTVMCTNLGSINMPTIYHHLNNYGTNSMMIAIGELRSETREQKDGTEEIRFLVDLSATWDERIADGFYFAQSLQLAKYLFEHPEELLKPMREPLMRS